MTATNKSALAALTTVLTLGAFAPEAIAQVSSAAAETKVVSFFSFFVRLVQIAGFSLFTIAVMTVGYKATFVEGFKIADAKGVVIGGLIFGMAGLIATYLVS